MELKGILKLNYFKSGIKEKRKELILLADSKYQNSRVDILKNQNPNNEYKINYQHWYKILGLTEDNLSAREKRKKEFLQFLSGLSDLEAQLYWQDKSKEIEQRYKLENLEKISEDKWRKVKPTWRNTKGPDKVLFFAMIDKEQDKQLKQFY
mmetsp:Transcript_4913/g.4166  ORF Transcript_4913/g.4166 Transcript_4913/m.4166 type:complete len:151 (+) Transcript_4913:267-719(+)